MKPTIKTPAVKTARFTVTAAGIETLKTNKRDEALAQVDALQLKNNPLITLQDEREKTATEYKKEGHQQNYRIQAGAYSAGLPVAKIVPAAE